MLKDKNRIFIFGLRLLLIMIAITIIALIGLHLSHGGVIGLVWISVLPFLVFPGIILSVILIIVGLLLGAKKADSVLKSKVKSISKPLIIITILIILFVLYSFLSMIFTDWPRLFD